MLYVTLEVKKLPVFVKKTKKTSVSHHIIILISSLSGEHLSRTSVFLVPVSLRARVDPYKVCLIHYLIGKSLEVEISLLVYLVLLPELLHLSLLLSDLSVSLFKCLFWMRLRLHALLGIVLRQTAQLLLQRESDSRLRDTQSPAFNTPIPDWWEISWFSQSISQTPDTSRVNHARVQIRCTVLVTVTGFPWDYKQDVGVFWHAIYSQIFIKV